MPRFNSDELAVLREFAAGVAFVPVDVWRPVIRNLPPSHVSPIAHPLYTLRLAVGSVERVCELAGIEEWRYRRVIDGVDHVGELTLARLAVGCREIGKVDHAELFEAYLGVVLARAPGLDPANETMYKLLTEWAYEVGPKLPGNLVEELETYVKGVWTVFVNALKSVDGEGETPSRAVTLLAALRAPDSAYVDMVARSLYRRGMEAPAAAAGVVPSVLPLDDPGKRQAAQRVLQPVTAGMAAALVMGVDHAKVAHRRGRPPGAKNKPKVTAVVDDGEGYVD